MILASAGDLPLDSLADMADNIAEYATLAISLKSIESAPLDKATTSPLMLWGDIRWSMWCDICFSPRAIK